jgi:hypothetical protein
MNDETFLNEPIRVVALFKNGYQPCVPVRFRRANGREITVRELGLRHPVVQGSKTVHVFEVTDGAADYRLEFDSERLQWRLTMEADHYDAL